jgi:hypothetical protein
MKNVHLLVTVLLAVLAVSGCKKREETASSSGGGGGAAAEKAGAAPEAAPVELSDEMKAFLEGWDGDHAKVEAALAAHGAEGLDAAEMDLYDLAEPKVIARNDDGDAVCFTFEAKAGITVRTYDVCWNGGKITKVVDQGMR